MDPTANVKLNLENKDAKNNQIVYWVRELVNATIEDPKDDIKLVLNDEKLEDELWGSEHCGETFDYIAVFVSVVNDDNL